MEPGELIMPRNQRCLALLFMVSRPLIGQSAARLRHNAFATHPAGETSRLTCKWSTDGDFLGNLCISIINCSDKVIGGLHGRI